MIKNVLPVLFLFLSVIVQAQYSETFSTPNKGYLINNVNDFTGVGWTLSPWNSGNGNRDVSDYFQTTGAGKLESIDLDEEVCWTSPNLTVTSTGNISFTADITWAGFDVGQTSPLEYVIVEYQINGGAWVRHPNVLGANGDANYTVRATAGATPNNGSATTNFGAIAVTAGNSFKVRMCASDNANAEVVTLDNVNVTGVTAGGCVAPTIGIATTQAGSCNSTNGSIIVTATGGTPGYHVAWGGTESGNPGGIEIAASGGMYTITGLDNGPYTVTVTDAASCTATSTATVTVATAMSLNTFALPTTCIGVNDGEIDLSVNNGVPPYSYSWSNLPGFPDPQDQTGLATGAYTVTVTGAAGCTTTTSATISVAAAGAYLETFSLANKGYLTNFVDDFAGVNWTLSNWTPMDFGRQAEDFFSTSAGALKAQDLDEEVCWTSPPIDINPPGTGIGFNLDLSWTGFDDIDYIDVKYNVDGGGYVLVPNQVGGGLHTIEYTSGLEHSGSTNVGVNSLSGNSLQIRVCGDFNANLETMTIDNVSVPGSNGLYCPCPIITFTATPASTCSGSNNGQIAVTGVTGGTGPYMYSKDNGANFQSGATFTGLAAGMYNVMVKDGNGCLSAATQVTVGTFSLPAVNCPAGFPVCIDAATFALTGATPMGGNYSGAGVTANNFNAASAGTGPHIITYSYTDGNGCTNSCTFTITVNPSPTAFNMTGGGSYCSGDPGVAVGLSGSQIGAQYDLYRDGNFVSSLLGTGNPLSFGLQTTAGSYQVIAVISASNCTAVMSGAAIVAVQSCIIDFSGTIVWEHDDATGVKDATVNLTGSAMLNDLTDVNGEFLITSGLTSGSFTLKPVKNINKLNGVTTADASAIQQHVAAIFPITDPYKLVCADVNKSNSVSSLDASIIIQAILGNPAALNQNQFKTSWRFVPSSHVMQNPPWGFPEQITYPAITTSQSNQNFIGMKTGDVTGSADPANLGAPEPLVLRTSDRMLSAGEQISVAFAADKKADLAAFQYALRFDPLALEFVSLEPLTALPLTNDNFGLFNMEDGEIRVAWAQATGVDVETSAPVFRVHFNALSSDVLLSDVLRTDPGILSGLAYTSGLEEMAVELQYGLLTGTNTPGTADFVLLQNRPNPFNGTTTIGFILPDACEAQLRIFDVSGRLLVERSAQYPAGKQEEVFDLAGFTGVLYYELVTSFGTLSKRMLLTGK